MQLSWASLMPKVPHDAAVALAAALGYEAYDLILIGNEQSVRLDDVRSDVAGSSETLAERIRGRGLEIADVFAIADSDPRTMAANHPDPRERARGAEVFEDMVELASRLGCAGLTMLPGMVWPDEDHEEALRRSAQELTRRVHVAGERGLRFSVEPHLGSVCRSPDDVERLLELVPGLELTLDYSHFVCQGVAPAALEPLLAHSRHFHARGCAPGRLQAARDENTIDWDRVVDAMAAHGYDGYIAVEFVWSADEEGLNGVDVVSETVLRRERLQPRLGGAPTLSSGEPSA
jgi:sugar phosphate isomerase/epimerase